MAKKTEAVEEPIALVGEEYGREDLNNLAKTLNKLIAKING